MDKQLVDTQGYENKGKELYHSNRHYRKLATVMEHPEFREFFNDYMKDWDTAKTILLFMKVYEAVEKHSPVTLNPYQKIAIVKDVVDNPNLREKVCQGINAWVKGEKSTSSLDNKSRSYIE